MNEAIWLAVGACSTVFGSAVSFATAARRERAAGEARAREVASRYERELERARARVAEATRQHRIENVLLRGALGLAGHDASTSGARGPRFDMILERLRGVAFVDAAVVADAEGLVLRGAEDALARQAASLASAALPLSRWQGAPCAAEIRLTFADSTNVAIRPLPLWAGEAFLVVASKGRAPSRLALEASDAMARLMDGDRGEPTTDDSAFVGWTHQAGGDRSESARQLLQELSRFRASIGIQSIALSLQDDLLGVDTADGASEALFESMRKHSSALARFAGRRLHSAPRRCDVLTTGGSFFSWVPLPDSSKFAIMTQSRGRPIEDLDLDRLVGKIRRLTVRESASTTGRSPGVSP